MSSEGDPAAEVALLRAQLAEERAARRAAEAEVERLREAMGRHQRALVDLARRAAATDDSNALVREALKVSATTLEVARVSAWLLSHDGSSLECISLYELAGDTWSGGARLAAADYPAYFAALDSGRAIDATDARTDPRTAEFKDGYLVPLGITSMMDAPIRMEGRVAGVICHEHTGAPRAFTPDEVAFAGALADQVALALAAAGRRQLEREREATLRELSRTNDLAHQDPLTGLANRRALEMRLAQELGLRRLLDQPLALAMLDIDHFKKVNDRHGHLVGDEVLRRLAAIIRERARSTDTAARYGGEEIVLVLPNTSGEQAVAMLERLRKAIAAQPLGGDACPELKVTVSIGLAVAPDDATTPEALLAAADRAMYAAKGGGRNCLVRSGEPGRAA